MHPVHAQTPKYEKVLEKYSQKDRYESGKGMEGKARCNLPCGRRGPTRSKGEGREGQTLTVKNGSGGLFQQHMLEKWAPFSRQKSVVGGPYRTL